MAGLDVAHGVEGGERAAAQQPFEHPHAEPPVDPTVPFEPDALLTCLPVTATARPALLPTTIVVEPEPVAPDASVAVAVAVYVPATAYVCATLVLFPGAEELSPSPKSTTINEIALPVVGVAAIVNTVAVPAVGLLDAEMVTGSCGFAVTVTLPEPTALSPNVSNAVTRTLNVPVWL